MAKDYGALRDRYVWVARVHYKPESWIDCKRTIKFDFEVAHKKNSKKQAVELIKEYVKGSLLEGLFNEDQVKNKSLIIYK